MTWNDPLRGLDAWLTREPDPEPEEEQYEAWLDFCKDRNGEWPEKIQTILGPMPALALTPVVPVEADDPDHPDHAIYEAWLALELAIQARENRLEAEAYEAEHVNEHGNVIDYGPQFDEGE